MGLESSLVTSMDKDGTRSGFDLALTKGMADNVGIPVIASGVLGASIILSILERHASAVLAASIFILESLRSPG